MNFITKWTVTGALLTAGGIGVRLTSC